MALFDKKDVNTGRQIEADIAKAICIVGMILIHSNEVVNGFAAPAGAYQFVMIKVLNCIFGAGTFMFCMGMGIAYSHRSTPEYLMMRGLRIFVLGYLLNIVRSALFFLIFDLRSILGCIFALDVLQFAGLALFLFGLLKKIKVNDVLLTVIAVLMNIAGSLIGTIDFESDAADLGLGLFINTLDLETLNAGVFPLLNWFLFVVAGYLFGKLLRHVADKKKFYLIFSGISGAVVAAYMLVAIPRRLGMMGSLISYYCIRLYDVAVCVCAAVFVLGVYHFLSIILPVKFKNAITEVSRNVNIIYCLQWVLITWSWFIIAAATSLESLSDSMSAVLGLCVTVISILLAKLIRRGIEKKKAKSE